METFILNAWRSLKRHLFGVAIQLVIIIVIARFYGSEGNGVFALVLLLPNLLVSLLTMGLESANVYLLGSKKVQFNEVFFSNVFFALLITLIGLALGALLIVYGAEYLFPKVRADLIWLALACFPGFLMQKLTLSMLQGLQEFSRFNLACLLYPVFFLIFILSLLFFDLKELSFLVISNLVAIYFSVGSTLLLLRSHITSAKKVDISGYLSSSVRYGLKVHLSNILSFINYKADLFLVNIFLNPLFAGVYVVAVQISERLWLLSQAVSVVLFPVLSSMPANDDARETITSLAFRVVLYITVVSSLLLSAVSYYLVSFLFGQEYIAAVIPILVLQPGIIALAVSRVIANDIAARGVPELNMYSSLLVIIVNIIGNIILIPILGLIGAALATSLAYTLNLMFRLVIYRYLTACRLASFFIVRRDDFRYLKSLLAS